MTTLNLNLPTNLKLSEDQFENLVWANRESKFELTATGELLIMSPTGGETGNRNFELYIDLGNWNRQKGLGKAFDSSTGFQLPNGAKRSPDLSWITLEKWNALTPTQRRKFLPICPDFVVELVSESDDLKEIEEKMQEYLDNGLGLGWLIIPKIRQVQIYRPQQAVEMLASPMSLSGESVLVDFVLDLTPIW
ncbi:MAG: Uma2 family endonuclease [Snowella sp.]|nr:Uma2 family endonuclease [Snowella sp.]